MTTTEYAKHRGVSDSYIRRMRREGRVVGEGRLIDVAATDALLDDSTHPLRGGDRTEHAAEPAQPASSGVSIADGIHVREAVRRERLAKARLAELELGEKSGDLARRKEVDRHVFTMARQALERLRTVGSRLRTSLAATSDPRECEALIDAEVRIVCDEMIKAAAELRDSAGAASTEREAA